MRLDASDPLWPREFEVEAARIEQAVADAELVVQIEHVGSTSVAGLVARPVIDILVGVPTNVPRQPYVAVLRDLGYEAMSNDGVRGRARFRRGSPISHVVDLTGWSSRYWREETLFRDYLREHSDVAREYDAVKRQIAGAAEGSRDYADEKGRFIRRVLLAAWHHRQRRE